MGGEEHLNSHYNTRVNGAILQNFHGKHVCLMGTVIKADGGGTAFQVKGCDGQGPINIRLKTPITEPLSGLVEIYGMGQGKNLIIAESVTNIPEALGNGFEMNTYNELVKLIHTVPENALNAAS